MMASRIFVKQTEDTEEVIVGELMGEKKLMTYFWAMMHMDGLYNIFGPDVYEAVRRSNGERLFINVTATVVE